MANVQDFPLDTAYIQVINQIHKPLTILSTNTDCFKCSDTQISTIDSHSNVSISINTKYDYVLKVVHTYAETLYDASSEHAHEESPIGLSHGKEICSIAASLKEKSISALFIKRAGNTTECSLTELDEGINSYVPIYVAIGIYFILGSIAYILASAYWRYKSGRGCSVGRNTDAQSLTSDARSRSTEKEDDEDNDQSPASITSGSADATRQLTPQLSVTPQKYKMRRVKSLDAFRGLTILLMIFVNYGAGGYSFLEHRPWYGVTMADVIFPAFIFMMGVSITLSTKSQLTRKKDYLLLCIKIVKRSLKLILIGLILNTDFTPLGKIRIPGVLQRFGISYLIVASIHTLGVYRGNKYMSRTEEATLRQMLLIFAPEILIHSLILIVYLYFTLYYKYSDSCPKGYQGPGGLEHESRFFNCTGGASAYIDKVIFGADHIYQTPTSQSVYNSGVPFDPEGLLGTLPSILLTQVGLMTGRVLLSHRDHYKRLIRWFILATLLSLLAFILSATDYIPVVKNLWSLSYVSLCGAICLLVLIAFYLWIDVLKAWSKGVPFHYPGTNAIILYIGHIVMRRYTPFWFNVSDDSHSWLLFRDLASTTIWLLISIYLYYSKIFFTL